MARIGVCVPGIPPVHSTFGETTMNNDQHNGALKFSLAGLLARGAIAAYSISPAVHQALAASVSYVLLAVALAAWGWITYQAKQRDTNGLHVFGALAVDAAVACAFTWAAITIAINYRQYDIMTDELWRLTGPGIFPGLQLDALIGMLAVGAVARALIPGRIYEDIGTRKIDYFSSCAGSRWRQP